jgi:mono/diheme cytochrome c family protein
MKSLYVYGGLTLAAVLLALASPVAAQFGPPQPFRQQGGEAIYKGICQDCHMPDGKGAIGAGAYPALGGNAKLEEPGYPVSVIVHGLKSMPAFGPNFTDQQVADIVNYIRIHFGNHYADPVTPADVKAGR